MELGERICAFCFDLRQAGIPVSAGQVESCLRGLNLIDWGRESVFYSALQTTLVNESAFFALFDEIYRHHFHHLDRLPTRQLDRELESILQAARGPQGTGGGGQGEKTPSEGMPGIPNHCPEKPPLTPGIKNPLAQDMFPASYEEIKRMEATFPLLARRLAARMVKKTRRYDHASLDFRKTVRASLAYGGIPVQLYTRRKWREKPVIFALCDVSDSCLHFSYFSLALVYSLERFFRQVRSFAFVDQSDEVSDLLRHTNPANLRARVLWEADVIGGVGYTDYGNAFQTFLDGYGQHLSARSTVLIFGDARTNWFAPRSQLLKEIKERVKRVYWFIPEAQPDWEKGDSSMSSYQPYCDRVFECLTLEDLARSLEQL